MKDCCFRQVAALREEENRLSSHSRGHCLQVFKGQGLFRVRSCLVDSSNVISWCGELGERVLRLSELVSNFFVGVYGFVMAGSLASLGDVLARELE